MNIYIVKAMATDNGYYESVTVLNSMVEKNKTFVGNGKKINKDSIGKIEESNILGGYRIVLTDESEILEARKNLKSIVLEYNIKLLSKYEKIVSSIESSDPSSYIEFIQIEKSEK